MSEFQIAATESSRRQSRLLSGLMSRRVYVWIGIVTLLIIGSIGTSMNMSTRMAQILAPQVDAAMEIKLEASLAHLWLEEIIGGDQFDDIDLVWQHLDQSAWYAHALLEGGTNPEGSFESLDDPVLRQNVEELLANIIQLRAVAEERAASISDAGVGTEIDQRFDKMFEEFLMRTDLVETNLQQKIASTMRQYRAVQGGLILIAVCLAVAIGLIIKRYEHSKAMDFEKLRKSEERFWTIASTAPVSIYETDESGAYWYVNPYWTKIAGLTIEQAQGEGWINGIYPEDREIVRSNWGKMVASQSKWGVEYRFQDQDGRITTVYGLVAQLLNEDGSTRGFIGINIDITERKMAEEEREKLIHDLQKALSEIKTLSGLLPICAHCKNIRDENDNWHRIEKYIDERSEAEFSHGICPDCAEKYYPGIEYTP